MIDDIDVIILLILSFVHFWWCVIFEDDSEREVDNELDNHLLGLIIHRPRSLHSP